MREDDTNSEPSPGRGRGLDERDNAPPAVAEKGIPARKDTGGGQREQGSRRRTRSKDREIEKLKKELAEKEELANAYYAQIQRLQADFENYKKRVEAERATISNSAVEGFVTGLLDALDNFERGIESLKKLPEEEYQGMRMAYDSLERYLRDHGLERLESVGKRFDPRQHEAIMQEAVERGEDGVVLDEFQPGYAFRGRVIRPGRVKVARRVNNAASDGGNGNDSAIEKEAENDSDINE